jgi:transposase
MTNGLSYRTERIDHLGIVSGICQEIGLIETIDQQIGETGRQVSVGQAVQAMVLNGLGFASRALYLTPEFFRNKPVARLMGAEIKAEQLNDDTLSDALDRLYEAGVTELFAQVARQACEHYEIEHGFHHLDSSSFHLHGQYPGDSEPSKAITRECAMLDVGTAIPNQVVALTQVRAQGHHLFVRSEGGPQQTVGV